MAHEAAPSYAYASDSAILSSILPNLFFLTKRKTKYCTLSTRKTQRASKRHSDIFMLNDVCYLFI